MDFTPTPRRSSIGWFAPRFASRTPFLLPSAPRQLHNLVWGLAGLEQKFAFGLEGAGGTGADALAAEYAGGLGQGPVKKGADLSVEAAAFEIDGIGELGVIGADLDAAPAQDAFAVIANEHGVVVQQRRLTPLGLGEALGDSAVVARKGLDLGRL